MNRPWIQTFTGRAVHPLDPDVDSIAIEDIAHSLAMQCRFTGHTREFYSVAEHSVRVSLAVPRQDALWGLLHDASEAYLTDLCRPLKRHTTLGYEYRKIESRVMATICLRFGLGPVEPASVAIADRRLLMTEKRDLLGPEPLPWTHDDEPLPEKIRPWGPAEAESMFLRSFAALTGARA